VVLISTFCVVFYLINVRPKSEPYCFVKTHEIMRSIFQFQPTNAWSNLRASGGDTSGLIPTIFGRKSFEYFLMQGSDEAALKEIQSMFSNRKVSNDLSYFLYLPDDSSSENIRGRAFQIAPWWNGEQQGACTHIYLGTNISGTLWFVDMYGYSRGSNSLLLTHIQKVSAD